MPADNEDLIDPTWEQLAERRGLLDVLDGETDRQLASVGERTRSMATRAAILVSSASIVAGIRVVPFTALAWETVAAALAGAVAALLGTLVLLPRKSTEVRLRDAELTLWNANTAQSIWLVMHWKRDTLKEQERALVRRSYLVVAGFGALALSLIFSVIELLP